MYLPCSFSPLKRRVSRRLFHTEGVGRKKWRVIKDTDVSRLNWKNGLVDRVGGDSGRKCEPETRAQNPRKRRIVPIRGGKKKRKKKKEKEKRKRNSRQRAAREQVSRQKAQSVEQGRRGERTEKENRMQRYATRGCTVLHARIGTTFFDRSFSLLVSS